MGFQLAYGEHAVLVSALTIAIQAYEERITNTAFFILRDETEAQKSIASAMLARLIGPTEH